MSWQYLKVGKSKTIAATDYRLYTKKYEWGMTGRQKKAPRESNRRGHLKRLYFLTPNSQLLT